MTRIPFDEQLRDALRWTFPDGSYAEFTEVLELACITWARTQPRSR